MLEGTKFEGTFISRFKNKLEYIELYMEDLVLIKRRKMNIRLMGLLLFHNYLRGCDGDLILLMEIHELERKLEVQNLTPFVKGEVERMLREKRADYTASKNSKDFVSGLIEFEKMIEQHKTPKDIFYHAEQIINKLKKYNPKFDPNTYIEMYLYRQECPKNPFVIDDYERMVKTPRKRLVQPKKKNSIYDYTRYEQ